MTDTAVDIDTFADIVADVPLVHHVMCAVCYPEDEADQEQRGVCGVVLIGIPAPPDSVMCDDCEGVWPEHLAGHFNGGFYD
jgi:hypothetical protein